MTTLAQSVREIHKPWQWAAVGAGILLIWAAIAMPRLYRSTPAAEHAPQTRESMGYPNYVLAPKAESAIAQHSIQAGTQMNAIAERKIIRTSTLDMVVQHPAESADKIAALAEQLGGYVETSNGGGPDANSASLTIRIPAAQFERARTEIHKLGLRVQSDRLDSQDVTQQYVDQDARIRNLRAEEAGYLAILKHASTVKDMLAVSERLSEVRGQIEQQQAEFNALSKQVETVSLAISLRTEIESQLFGLNWRPLYQLKIAAHDGLESLATYATAMMAILFFLPAALLWVTTILLGIIVSWRILRWVNNRWLGAKITTVSSQS